MGEPVLYPLPLVRYLVSGVGYFAQRSRLADYEISLTYHSNEIRCRGSEVIYNATASCAAARARRTREGAEG
jgi:hypothetical protein